MSNLERLRRAKSHVAKLTVEEENAKTADEVELYKHLQVLAKERVHIIEKEIELDDLIATFLNN